MSARLTDAAFARELVAQRPWLVALARKLKARDPEDLAQSTMLRAWTARERYVDPSRGMRCWLSVIAKNLATSEKRHSWRWSQLPEDHELALAPDDQLAVVSYRQTVERVFPSIRPEQLAALVRVGLGDSYDEAAPTLAACPGTVKTRVRRARLALRAAGAEP